MPNGAFIAELRLSWRIGTAMSAALGAAAAQGGTMSQSRSLSQLLDGPMSEDDDRDARALIKRGLQLNDCDESGCSPFICAVRSSHGEIALLLLQNGADVNARNSFGWSALDYLFSRIDDAHADAGIDLAGEIIRRGARMDLSKIFHFERPLASRFLERLLDFCDTADIVRFRTVPNFSRRSSSMSASLLHLAVLGHNWFQNQPQDKMKNSSETASLSLMSKLISLGVPVDCPTQKAHKMDYGDEDSQFPQTPLGIAVQYHWFDAVQLLLHARADPNVPICLSGLSRWGSRLPQNSPAYTLLMHAAYSHQTHIMKALIEASANVASATERCDTALTEVLQKESAELFQALKLLIEAAADCNVVLSDGTSALALAIKCQSSVLSRIERNTDHAPSVYVQLQREFQQETAVMLLLRNGARVSQTELHLAADLCLPNVARHLLCHGGSFTDILAHSCSSSFLRLFLYPAAILVASCKILHFPSLPKLLHLLPLPLTPPPLRLRALCIGGLLRNLLKSLGRPLLSERQLQRSQLPRLLLPVLRVCTGLASVYSSAAVKHADPGFVQLDKDFALSCGLLGYSWLPPRLENTLEEILPEEEQASPRACVGSCTLL